MKTSEDYAREGGSAFPFVENGLGGETSFTDAGMTLRDWMAGQVLVGISEHGCKVAMKDKDPTKQSDAIARLAYTIADAMLRARQRAPEASAADSEGGAS